MSELDNTIKLIAARRGGEIPPERARFQVAMTRLLAQGQPVSAQRLAAEVNVPVDTVEHAFEQMQQSGCEFNTAGELVGAALTLTPTQHQFRVNHQELFAWCALDTLFLPAYIGQTAHIKSTCPQTGATILLAVSPEGVEMVDPTSTVLSIMTAKGCTSGPQGTFCGQVHFFASREAALEWIGKRGDFSILTVAEAYQLARRAYIEPMLKHN